MGYSSGVLLILCYSRAGRFGTKGLAITFVSSESDQQVMAAIQSRFEVAVPELPDHIDPASYSTCSAMAVAGMLTDGGCSDVLIRERPAHALSLSRFPCRRLPCALCTNIVSYLTAPTPQWMILRPDAPLRCTIVAPEVTHARSCNRSDLSHLYARVPILLLPIFLYYVRRRPA